MLDLGLKGAALAVAALLAGATGANAVTFNAVGQTALFSGSETTNNAETKASIGVTLTEVNASLYTFTFDVNNDTLVAQPGGNRLTVWGLDSTPTANVVAGSFSADSGTWFTSSGNVPGEGQFQFCVKDEGGPNCAGGGGGGIAEGEDVLFTVTFNVGTATSFKIDSMFARFQSVGTNSSDSNAFLLGVVPLPAAGWMLIAGLGGLAAMRRMKKSA